MSEAAERGRVRGMLDQFVRYFGVALIGLVVDFGTLVLLTSVFHVYYLLGATAGFILGLLVTYVLSERFVFTAPRVANGWIRFLIFGLIGLVGLGLLNGIMWVLTDWLGLFYVWSKVAATVVVYIWNFFARRSLYGPGVSR